MIPPTMQILRTYGTEIRDALHLKQYFNVHFKAHAYFRILVIFNPSTTDRDNIRSIGLFFILFKPLYLRHTLIVEYYRRYSTPESVVVWQLGRASNPYHVTFPVATSKKKIGSRLNVKRK